MKEFKHLDKLRQADRIEYILKEKIIKDKYDYSPQLTWLIIIAFCLLSIIVIMTSSKATEFLSVAMTLTKIIIIMFLFYLVEIFISIGMSLFSKLKANELMREYFEVIAKRRKR